MKNVILILVSLLTFTCVKAQSELDKYIFEKVNQYRVSLGVAACEYDSVCFNAAKLQATYLTDNKFVGHSNPIGTSKERYVSVGGQGFASTAEVCTNIKPINAKTCDSVLYNKLADRVVEAWKASDLHNKAILSADYKFAGVNAIIVTTDPGIKGYLNYQVYAVMFFTNLK